MARVRVHQHVNPLSPHYRQAPDPVELSAVFAEPGRPLLLDIGCARGRFLLKLAQARPEFNFLGVEIREPLVDEANRLAAEAGLTNLRYLFCNAMLWLNRAIAEIPNGVLQYVTIQFPDPWFKKRHAKRRMVNADLVLAIADRLAEGGEIFIQTDIEFLADEMFALFDTEIRLLRQEIIGDPMPVKTEREIAVLAKGLPIYRALYVKKSGPASWIAGPYHHHPISTS